MIPDMPNMISAARIRNIRFFLVVQSAHQLETRYGTSADTIKGNCENWVFLASKELALLNEIQDLCGTRNNSADNREYLISSSQLQRLDKQRGEALHLFGRCYLFIAEMADIDDYPAFLEYDAPPLIKRELPDPECFDVDDFLSRCASGISEYPFRKTRKSSQYIYTPDASIQSKTSEQILVLSEMAQKGIFYKDRWITDYIIKTYGAEFGFGSSIFRADKN